MGQIFFSIIIMASLLYLGPNQDQVFLHENYDANFFSKIYLWWFSEKIAAPKPLQKTTPEIYKPYFSLPSPTPESPLQIKKSPTTNNQNYQKYSLPKNKPIKVEMPTSNMQNSMKQNTIKPAPEYEIQMQSDNEPNRESELKEVERELKVIIDDHLIIGSDHIQKLQNRINDLSKSTIPQSRISDLQKTLDTIISKNNVPEISNNTSNKQSCQNNAKPIFTYDITDLSQIYKITPPGTIFDNGGVVKSHSYLWIKNSAEVPIYAPIDMELLGGSYSRDSETDKAQYLLFFKVNCEVEIKFDHIDRPIESIITALPQTPALRDSRTSPAKTNIKFKAGDLIAHTNGTSKAQNWDFGVYNTTVFPNPVTNNIPNLQEIDKRADCAYDYFSDPKKQTYKNLFQVQIGGSSKSIPYCK